MRFPLPDGVFYLVTTGWIFGISLCACVVIPFILQSQTYGRTSRGYTGFLLPSTVLALTFIARRIQPSLSLVDLKSNFVCPRNNRSPHVGHDVGNPSSCDRAEIVACEVKRGAGGAHRP